jgi:hypothetical protein
MRAVSDYLSLLAEEHRGKPKFEATIGLLTSPMVALQLFLANLPSAFDLDVAVGVQLDIDGIWIGRSRQIEVPLSDVFFSFDTKNLGFDQGVWFGPYTASEGLVSFDDTTYRALLRAKVICNNWDGTVTEMQTALRQILNPYPGSVLGVIDNYNMTMDIGLAGTYPPPLIFYLVTGGYIPFKPEGVALNIQVTSVEGKPLFGLDIETNFISGLDVGALGVAPTVVPTLPATAASAAAIISGGTQITASAATRFGAASKLFSIGGSTVNTSTPTAVVAALTGVGSSTVNTTQPYRLNPTVYGTALVTPVAAVRQRASVTISGAVTTLAYASPISNAFSASSKIAGTGTAQYAVTESLTSTTAPQPGEIILASQTPGSAAPTNGPFDSWEINSAGNVLHNGTIDTTTSVTIALYYKNHMIYRVSSIGNSFGTPGWYSWSGSVWTAVANPTTESSAGTFGVYTV